MGKRIWFPHDICENLIMDPHTLAMHVLNLFSYINFLVFVKREATLLESLLYPIDGLFKYLCII